MALLQIDRIAITDEDAEHLVNQTLALRNPFGVPTIFFKPSEFDKVSNISGILSIVNARLQEFSAGPEFNWLDGTQRDRLFSAHADTGYVRSVLAYTRRKTMMPECKPLPHVQFQNFADQYSQHDYKDPLYNVALVGNTVEQDFVANSGIAYVPKEKIHFHALWHELAHGTGAGEPQADTMAGCITLKAFQDSSIIKWQADKRAFEAVNLAQDQRFRERFGWAMVDANDLLASQSQDRILALSEEQIRAMRFARFQTLSDTVARVAGALEVKIKEKREKSLPISYSAIADELSENEFKDDTTASYMARRFALANYRLRKGAESYKKPLGVLPPDGKYPTIIDEPEFPPPA